MSDRSEKDKETARRREPGSMWTVMYPLHFGMRENPFPPDADPRFLWLGGKRGDILESLVSGILSGENLQVVTGKPGTGKSMLAHALLDQLGDRVTAAVVPCAEYKGIDFPRLVERAYGIGGNPQSQGSFASRFSEFLRRSFSSGQRVVLIVDDAHRLLAQYLDEFSELSRLEESGTRLMSLVYFGESSLLDLLDTEPDRDPSKNVIRSFTLDPLTREETSQYLQHRLRQARCEGEPFEREAIDEIFAISQGVPGLIDRACDAALSRAYYVGEKRVTQNTVKDAFDLMPAEETGLPESVPDLSFTMRDEADREREEDADEQDAPGIPAGKARARERSRKGILYAVLGAVVVASVVAAVVFMKGREQKVPPVVAEKQRELPLARPAVRGAVAPPETSIPPPEIPARQQVPAVTAGEKVGDAREVRAVRKKTRETAASRPHAVRARQAPAASPTREAVAPERVSPGSEAAPGTSAGSGEAASREPARQGSEQVESGEVIDFMLKKRSGQR